MAATGAAAIPAVAAVRYGGWDYNVFTPCTCSQDYIVVRDSAPCATYHYLYIPYISNDNTTFTALVRLNVSIVFILLFMDYVEFKPLQIFFNEIV